MTMPDLKDPQNEWEIKEVLDHHKIKNTVHYLIKWVNWLSEYNFYKSATHLANASKLVDAYEQKLKHKQKNKNVPENCKQSCKNDDDWMTKSLFSSSVDVWCLICLAIEALFWHLNLMR